MEKYSTYERNESKIKEYHAWRIVKSISKILYFLHLSSVVPMLIFTLLNFHKILVTAQSPNFINSGLRVGNFRFNALSSDANPGHGEPQVQTNARVGTKFAAKNVKDVSRSGEPSRTPPSLLASS